MGASNAAGRSDKPTGPPRILFQESRRPPADDAVRKLRSEVTGDVFSCVTCFRNRYGDQPQHSDAVDKGPSPAQITSYCELCQDRKSTRLNSSHVAISYAVFCLKKKKKKRHVRQGKQSG